MIWSAPILIAMAIEFRQTRRGHPIYLIGLGVFAVRAYNGAFMAPSAADALLQLVGTMLNGP